MRTELATETNPTTPSIQDPIWSTEFQSWASAGVIQWLMRTGREPKIKDLPRTFQGVFLDSALEVKGHQPAVGGPCGEATERAPTPCVP